jgi:hypothetical protein
MAETRIQDQDFYTGIIPTVFKKVDQSDVKVNPFQTNKFWLVFSGSNTSSALPLTAIYSDINQLPALGSELTFNDSSNIDGSLQTVTYFSVNHQFYKYKKNPAQTFGPTNLNQTKKHLYQSASIISFPQIRVGEGIKPASFRIAGNAISYYGTASYGTGSYTFSYDFKSDRYGNLYDTTFNTASIVTRSLMYEEGFNEYFDSSRVEYISNNITYVPGVTTTTGGTLSYGNAANFNGNGYIKTALPGYYDRNHDYAISFFIYANNTGSSNNLIIAKASSSLTPQYPFKIEVDPSNYVVFTIAGSTTFKSQLTSTITVDTVNMLHVVCQKSGSTMEIWIGGIQDIAVIDNLLIDTQSPFTASGRIDNKDPLFIGGFESGSNLTGTIDEIRIFNRALTATEIGYLADRTEGGSFMQTNHVGNVFARQGIAVISTPDYRFHNILNAPYTASYKSTVTTYELGVVANADAGDFNMSMNLTLTDDSDVTYKNFVTGSAFAPYITTIGLYDDAGQLLAIGKLAQPIRKRSDVDMNFLVRLDLDRNIK